MKSWHVGFVIFWLLFVSKTVRADSVTEFHLRRLLLTVLSKWTMRS
jgi:hypothetical protein